MFLNHFIEYLPHLSRKIAHANFKCDTEAVMLRSLCVHSLYYTSKSLTGFLVPPIPHRNYHCWHPN